MIVTPNKLDQFLSKWFPGTALKRAADRHNLGVVASVSTAGFGNAGYSGGINGRRKPTAYGSTDFEDEAASWTYHDMISNSMQLYRNDPMTKSIVNVSSTYLGESRPTATTSDPEWNKRATAWFNEVWWPQADARGRNGVDYGEIQNLFDTWSWVGGDMLFLLFHGQLLPFEGTQIETPNNMRSDDNIINGIRVRPSAPWPITHYYLTDPNAPRDSKNRSKRIRQSEAIYAGSRNWRVAMLRSVPDLHGVIDALHAFNRTNDNVQRRIEFESMLFTVERKGAVGKLPGGRTLNSTSNTNTTAKTRPTDWGLGLEINGSPKDDFLISEMKNPNSQYVQTMEFMARAIAAGTGFPYEVVMHIYTSGSFTANRAARLDFEKAILDRWKWRNKVLNRRVWNWRIAKAIKAGELPPAPISESTGLSEWHKASWTLPHFKHIDEGKEVSADIKQWGTGQESVADWAQNRGMTRDQLLDAHDMDIAAFKERAKTLAIPLEQYMGQLFSKPAQPEGIPNAKA